MSKHKGTLFVPQETHPLLNVPSSVALRQHLVRVAYPTIHIDLLTVSGTGGSFQLLPHTEP